jgi:hypothetical protein
MAKKPYIYESLEGWLQITRKKDWNDPSVNPQDLAPYSEFGKPYASDKDISYPEWEWSWPDDDLTPIDDLTYPDPIENECSIDENCVWAGIIGQPEMECGDCRTYSQAHLYIGCEVAPWWAAFGSWKLESNVTPGECFMLFSGPIMATVCCDDEAQGSFTITYEGPLDCKGSLAVQVSCDVCCEDFELAGAATVNDDAIWVGTISPACPGADCEVSSNSGCEGFSCAVNQAGSEVVVGVPENACGGFTVTVTDGNSDNDDCTASDSLGVRINNTGGGQPVGSWVGGADCDFTPDCNKPFSGVCYNHGVGINNTCVLELTKFTSYRQSCSTNLPGLGCGTGCNPANCPNTCGGSPCAGEPYNNRPCPCPGGGQNGWHWNLSTQFWMCEC